MSNEENKFQHPEWIPTIKQLHEQVYPEFAWNPMLDESNAYCPPMEEIEEVLLERDLGVEGVVALFTCKPDPRNRNSVAAAAYMRPCGCKPDAHPGQFACYLQARVILSNELDDLLNYLKHGRNPKCEKAFAMLGEGLD